ncbi:hypothetical protein CHH28_08230 [Bacterioplanes sanyensis]|uniref:DUF3108 domain-containing protein n=1 Tax=Bacterioplanes sanyensis TaxID=1249553 RepID=A0A222FJ95_9GAMM|nr:hypothetical protein [Bacterioplanes sanyensis]ASP38666.1 hypothetical protein CHH28_08230 [Bacterioplanes sanyensis]
MRLFGWIISALLSLPVQADTLNYEGLAFEPGTDRLLYREQHTLVYQQQQPHSREVRYFNADGELIATKSNQYGDNPIAPSFLLQDQRRDYAEQVELTEQGYIMRVTEQGQQQSARIEPGEQPLVIDSGFDTFVRQQWQQLLDGNTVSFRFAAPARQDVIDFRIIPVAVDEQQLQLEMRLQSRWLAWLLDPIQLYYDRNNQRLLRYVGLTNIQDDAGDGIEADIRYQYSTFVHN